jgi:hypothetical protein
VRIELEKAGRLDYYCSCWGSKRWGAAVLDLLSVSFYFTPCYANGAETSRRRRFPLPVAGGSPTVILLPPSWVEEEG